MSIENRKRTSTEISEMVMFNGMGQEIEWVPYDETKTILDFLNTENNDLGRQLTEANKQIKDMKESGYQFEMGLVKFTDKMYEIDNDYEEVCNQLEAERLRTWALKDKVYQFKNIINHLPPYQFNAMGWEMYDRKEIDEWIKSLLSVLRDEEVKY
jgi:predicted nucleotide-binding protein (sugar kinase/HSP70/actin superfamily)